MLKTKDLPIYHPPNREGRVSHGELIRDEYDETLTIDPNNLQLLYQGRDPKINARYDQLPYRLGLLKINSSAK